MKAITYLLKVGSTCLVAVVIACSLSAPIADAQAGPNYSVGTPPDPIKMRPGDKVEQIARVVNAASVPASFDVKIVAVDVHDEGSITEAIDRTDPAVGFVSTRSHVGVAAGQSEVLPLSISVPKSVSPDMYIVGLLITPTTADNTGVRTIDRILSPIGIDVDGGKQYAVGIDQSVKSHFVVGTKVSGSYTVLNRQAGVSVGRAVFVDRTFGGRATVPIAAGRTNAQGGATSKEIVPRAHRKTFRYTWHGSQTTVGFVRPLVEIGYTDDNGKTVSQASRGPRVFVVSQSFAALVVAVLLVIVATVATKVIRRRKARRKSHAASEPNDNEKPLLE